MCSNEDRDYLIEAWEQSLGENPFEGWTKEEYEEFMRELNGVDEYCEDDYRWSGRF